MNRIELFRMAFLNLWRRKARSVLSIIGVVIGTCSIVLMFSLGLGLTEQSRKSIENMGNIHIIKVQAPMQGGGMMSGPGGGQNSKIAKLDSKKIAEFSKIKGVTLASPVEQGSLTIGLGKKIMRTQVVAVLPEVMEVFGYESQEGRLIQKGDTNVLVFGSQTTGNFYDPRKSWGSGYYGNGAKPKGEEVITDKLVLTADSNYGRKQRTMPGSDYKPPKYGIFKAKGIGVLKEYNDERGWSVFTTLDFYDKLRQDGLKAEKAVNQRYSNFKSPSKDGYQEVWVYVKDINDMKRISDAIKKEGYQTYSMMDILESTQKQMKMIQAVFGGIGAVSLLVAALGITNTMIMSIYERTREIGVMKVIGANLTDIRNLFLTEAALIGLLGGLVGVLFSLMGSFIINHFMGSGFMMGIGGYYGGDGGTGGISLVPWWLILLALGVTTMVGILSGYYPARRAMGLSALESLKNE